jgi:thiamine-monophosphate kinase
MSQLVQLGERRIVEELLSERYTSEDGPFGDDCVILFETSEFTVVGTIDPAPKPVAWELGYRDYFYWGWLLSAINLSDLAAAGARPLCLLTSLSLPNDLSVPELTRFLDGVDACCHEFGTSVRGGNIREGSFHCEAVATGLVIGGRPLSRTGTQPADLLVALGPSGYFWSALLSVSLNLRPSSLPESQLFESLVRPRPQIELGSKLREKQLIQACTDASDGLYYAMKSLTVVHGLGFCLEPREITYPAIVQEVASMLKIDPIRLILGFGDFQLVCAVTPTSFDRVRAEADVAGVHVIRLGTVTETGRLEVMSEDGTSELNNFDNERLTSESQFTAGIDAYRQRLLEQPLSKAAR